MFACGCQFCGLDARHEEFCGVLFGFICIITGDFRNTFKACEDCITSMSEDPNGPIFDPLRDGWKFEQGSISES